MHILVLPSEEYVPQNNPLAGIFQHHQASILSDAGNKVGVISIRQSFSIPMLIRGFLFKCINKKCHNATDTLSIVQLLKLGYKKLFKLKEFITIEKKQGILVYHIEGFYHLPPSDVNNRSGWIKAGLAAYKEYVRGNGIPAVIHAHNALYAGMLAQKIGEKYGIPYVITEHSTVFARNAITSKKLLSYIQNAYRNSKSVYAVSQPFCDLLGKLFPGISFKLLPNVIDPYLEKKQFVSNSNTQNGDFVFLNIAELQPKKNHKLLIDSFKRLKQNYPSNSVKLWIGGNGVLFEELNDYIKQLGLNDEVQLLGHLNRQQIFESIMNSSCFVLSSSFETFGVVLIEAMLLGKPVITTRCGGPEGFVNKLAGVMVDSDSVEQLSEAMLQMIQSIENYNPAAIRQFALQEFGKESFVQRTTIIYNQIILS